MRSILGVSTIAVIFLVLVSLVRADYFIGDQGKSCSETCIQHGMNCNPTIVTNNSDAIFASLGIKCNSDNRPWWASDQPSYVADPKDPNYQKCLGYIDTPTAVLCAGNEVSVRRLCRCDAPSKSKTLFGTGLSNGVVTITEQYVFQHFVASGDYGVMTHFWYTIGNPGSDGIIVRYYVDGETTASIQFNPALAAGVGFDDTTAPWGLKWIGKGAKDGSYFINFKIPFQKSIVVTVQHLTSNLGGFYMIVRGSTNTPLDFGTVKIPSNAKLRLTRIENVKYNSLDLVTLAEAKTGQGVVIYHNLAVQSGNMNFLEGCYHWLTPDAPEFPGVVLSTGTEDYYDSGWYFDAGPFHLPTAGLTHLVNIQGQPVTFSAYRFHEADPLTFSNGFSFVWRNGDNVDASGIKCLTIPGKAVGSPTASQVWSQVWYYTW